MKKLMPMNLLLPVVLCPAVATGPAGGQEDNLFPDGDMESPEVEGWRPLHLPAMYTP